MLQNKTKGYRNHPQLLRFKAAADPAASIAMYLRGIYEEAVKRGYKFDAAKIDQAKFSSRIRCTRGQLLHEWIHFKLKLETRERSSTPNWWECLSRSRTLCLKLLTAMSKSGNAVATFVQNSLPGPFDSFFA